MHLDAEFWVAAAFVTFVAILWKVGAFRTLIQSLDHRSEQIARELDEARTLREEARQVLPITSASGSRPRPKPPKSLSVPSRKPSASASRPRKSSKSSSAAAPLWPNSASHRPKHRRRPMCALLLPKRQ